MLVVLIIFAGVSLYILYKYFYTDCDKNHSCQCYSDKLNYCALKYLECDVIKFLINAMSNEQYESLIKIQNDSCIDDKCREYLTNAQYVKESTAPGKFELTGHGREYVRLRNQLLKK